MMILLNKTQKQNFVQRSCYYALIAFLFVICYSSQSTAQVQGNHPCKLTCKDTIVCFSIPDSLVKPPKPTYSGADPGGGSIPCFYDSIWNNSPGVFPVGTTIVTWYVHNIFGFIDSCTQNIIRKPPSNYSIIFSTNPPIIGGVISICNGQQITFTDNSTGITGLLWNFGNGYYSSNSTHTEPAWHYPPGTYYDTLTVYDDCGNPHDTAWQVVVDSSSGPDIYCISVVCPGDTVTYHTHANCTSYTWGVAGGIFINNITPPSTSDSCTIVWGAGPTGTITLNVSGCTPALTCPFGATAIVHIVPATLPVAGDTVTCAGSKNCYSVECIPGNIHSWEMTPPNAGVITGQGTCNICIEWAPGFFGTVTLQINYNNVLTGAGCSLDYGCKNDPGCGGHGNITIHVKPIFGISGPTKVCPNVTSLPFNGMNLTNNTIAPGVSWKLVTPVPSTISFSNTGLLNAYTWNAGPGNYQLTAYAPPGVYCNDSATVTVQVINMLIPANISGLDTVCPNTPSYYTTAPNMSGVTYNWTVVGGTIIGPNNGNSVQISWNPGGGTIFVTQTMTNPPGCTSLASAIFVVKTWPNFILPIVTTSNPIVCLKSNVTYSIPPTLLSNATYTWSVVPSTAGNIITANGGNTITIHWVDASITPIWVKLKITRCYSDSVMFPINLLPLPPVPSIAYSPATPCANSPVLFTTTSLGPTWYWTFGDLGFSPFTNPSHTYAAAGTYPISLTVTNANGCSDTAFTNITVNGVPVVPVITGNNSVCVGSTQGYSFSQPLFMGANYQWSLSAPPLGTILSSSNTSCSVLWSTPGVDTVKLHVQSTCLDTIIKYVVTVHPLPTPGISVAPSVCVGSPLTFTGSGGATYSWIFSGGTPNSTVIPNPTVTYSLAGTYSATLNVVSAFGCTGTTTTNITVNPLPLAIITGPGGVCTFPTLVTLNAVVATGYQFLWSPTGSITSSTSMNISGPTTFSCVVTNSFGCTRTSNSITIVGGICDVIPGPCTVTDTIDFTATPPVCLSQTYTKIGGATLTGWSFGDGGSAGAVTPVTHTFPVPGIYPVQVAGTATGVDALGNPCSKIVAKTHMMTIPFDAHFDVSFQCNGANVMQTIFTNTSLWLGSAGSYQWTWKDSTNNTIVSSNAFPPPITLAAGSHLVYLGIYDPITMATCTLMKTINVPIPIQAAFTVSTPICQFTPSVFIDNSIQLIDEVSRLFNNGNASTSTLQTCSLTYVLPGPFTATLTVTDKYGCVSTASQPVFVNPPGTGTITIGPNSCDSVQLIASGPGPFTWNVINPPPFPTNPVYVKTSGFYSVSSFDVNGCPFTFGPVQVTVKQSPNATITGKTQYCQNENLDIKTQTAGATFVWTQLIPFAGVVGGNTPNLNIPLPTPGTITFQVTVTGANGCSSSATYVVTVDPVPSSAVIVGGPLTICQGSCVLLTVNPPGATYLWSKSPTPPLTPPKSTNDSLCADTSGTYSVIVQTPSGCAYPAIPPVTVTVNPIPPANITGDTVLCKLETLVLSTTSVGGVSYSWTGPSVTGNTNPLVVPNMLLSNSGPYIVVVTDLSTGCTNSDTINVIVNPLPPAPTIISNPGGVLCEGQLFNLSVVAPLGPPIVYTWSTGQIGTNINVALQGTYYVTATNQFGCGAQSNAITIHPLPDLSCAPSGCYDFCNECDSVVIPGPDSIFSYNWEMLVGNIFTFYSNTQNLTVFPPGGKYRLIAQNQWGCADSTDTLFIDFHDCCPIVDTINCLDTCIDFNNNNASGWIPYPIAPYVGLSVTNVLSQGGATDYYISATDLVGPSLLLGGNQLDGKWCCGYFCFDYWLVSDQGTGASVNPSFQIKSNTLGFNFISSTSVTQSGGWHTICAPISDCNTPPVSALGSWAPIVGTVQTDWPTVLSNVTEVTFKVDYINSTNFEVSAYDNFCIHDSMPNIDAGNDTTICEGDVITLHVEGCNNVPVWYELNGGNIFFVNNGPIIDVQPIQSTCYMVVCCGVNLCCCDTDTICVNVNPKPKLQWNVTIPDPCLNSAPIYLDTTNIFVFINNMWVPVNAAGGSGVFSGVGVVGNYFYPNTLGPHIITYTYTDSLGCSNSVSIVINVIFCCGQSCHVDLGNDTTVCPGTVLTLHAEGCSGSADWYELGGPPPGGAIHIGTGQIHDVVPQQNTCYMVICCCPDPVVAGAMCCDTDTICINLFPPVQLHWSLTVPDVCQNSAPIFLNANNIYVLVNNVLVPITSTTGTWVFSGPGVVGNFFYPNTLGPHTITVTYTDPNGCTGTATISINVIYCCGSSCQVNAGNDTTVCAGTVVILHAEGCSGSSNWYELGGSTGASYIGVGPIHDVIPQHNTCYMVICCCPDPINPGVQCCDTDTICINVFPPIQLFWPITLPDVCLNSAPVFLNANNIYVLVNNNLVPITSTTGTWVFSGPGVVGNYFYPNTLGSTTITVTYTDPNGCTGTATITINVINCCSSNCQANAGRDTTICAGSIVILDAQGCNGMSSWYVLGAAGPIYVGSGPIIDVTPTQNTCYMVICCCKDPVNPNLLCCDTDSVCINVFPAVHLYWPFTLPNICLNSAPVYLDANNIYVLVNNNPVPITSTTGTWSFSGPGVVGNYFYPNTLGPHTITVTYTDPNGCTGTATITINVIYCCQSSSCGVFAGNDTTVCAGSVVILTAHGCNGYATWYELANGAVGSDPAPIYLGEGLVHDVIPQQNTCYMVICCCPDPVNPGAVCCDTDTICINVFPAVHLFWPIAYAPVCQNSAPIFLDPSNIYVMVNNQIVPITSTTGTWYFSGPGVVGNYFYPNTLGPHTITVYYTDPNGCTGTATITIYVVFCCGQSCQVDAGHDTTVCAGSVVILTAQGCSGSSSWYQLGTAAGGGNIYIGQGPVHDVIPQQNTCYMVICCCPDPLDATVLCCDTDTICINVYPAVHITWPIAYADVCQNSAPIYLDANNIFVTVNNQSVPITSTNGTWYFSGTGVIGNYFYPNTLGTHTITVYYTDANGCTGTASITINVIYCCGTSCQVNAGNDTTVCAGSVVILTAQGCSGSSSWYQLEGAGGPVYIGGGPIHDVIPQQNTCYMVICCCPNPINPAVLCCDTDTICISVFPLVHLTWPIAFADVCLNSAPIYLDANNIFVMVNNQNIPITATTGTWYFSGQGVNGNYFYPNSLGPHTITVYYTDPNGCTGTATITINVIHCCGTACQVNAGNDTTVCAGSVVILTAQGCTGSATWYQLSVDLGLILIGNGQIHDVIPQQSTCYMVICCCPDPLNPGLVCCDTDTVCINVYPPILIDWPVVLQDVCLNGPAVYLDPNNIYVQINNTYVPIPNTGGTWYFTGQGVNGSYFYPTTGGSHIITVHYTAPNGCTTTTSIVINVIYCCETSCHVNLGNDTSICAGTVLILTANGCSGNTNWYQLTPQEVPIYIGSGHDHDVVPQQNTCYMVICCCPNPLNPAVVCCDTDTICVTVKPVPVIQWPLSYKPVCINSFPVYLNPYSILVYVGNTWVPAPLAGGSGFFSGPNVFGNFFYPSGLGLFTITYTYTAPNGCTTTVTNTIRVHKCGVKLDIIAYLEGYYQGNGLMNDNFSGGGLLHKLGYSQNYDDVDSVTVSIMESAMPYHYVEVHKGILHLDGTMSIDLGSNVVDSTAYYIKLNHRNSIETWSANPVMFNSPVTTYDFTSGQTQAYGGNMSETYDHHGWAIFSGDISSQVTTIVGDQDGVIESQDYGDMENAVYFTLVGYVTQDITGDGVVESADYGLMENNVYFTRIVMRP